MARATHHARRLAAAGLAGLLNVAGASAAATAEPAPAGDDGPAHLLVAWRPGTSRASTEADVARVGGTVDAEVAPLGVKVVALPDASDAAAALADLAADPNVAYAEIDQHVKAAETVPTDPLWPQQWGPVKTKTSTVWDTTTGDPSVIVAVLDSGVDATQPDLAGALLSGRDLLNNDNDPNDDTGHGTQVSGIVGARANDGIGIAGYCSRCAILPVKVLGPDGGSLSTVAAGITYAADNGAKVINMSLSAPAPSTTLTNAVSYARSRGAVVVAANGNDGDGVPQYPAASPGVIGVAGTNESDGRYSFSSFGFWAELSAPGCHTAPRQNGTWNNTFCGTSSATPAVAGIAGLLFAARPTATAAEVERALLTSAAPISGGTAANGRVDAAAALAALTAPPPPAGAGLPAAPTNLTATSANGAVVVAWTPPASNGGAALLAYRVTASPGGAVAQAGPAATSVPIGLLANGANYTFTVAAVNGVGSGPTSAPSPTISPRLVTIDRVAGAGRIETAVALSRRAFSGADDVVIARSDDYADALAASPLAGDLEAPLLLSTTASLASAVGTEVRRLRATTAYLAGGESVLSPAVEAGLRAAGITTIERIAGVNRFDTARLLAEQVGGTAVYLTEGANDDPARGWPDAVAVSGLAAFQSRPILLTNRDELPPETKAALVTLGATSATIVGGTTAVSAPVATAAGDPDGNGVSQVSVSRLGGATRWDTARLVADRAVGAGAGIHRLWMATGLDWPDALAAGPAAANKGAVLLLLDGQDLAGSPAASSWLTSQNRRFLEAVVVGGTGSVTTGAETAVGVLLW